MARHYNPSISQDARRILNLKGTDMMVSEVLDVITPVVPIGRVCNIVRAVRQDTTGTFTIFTTPSDKDFYLVAADLSTSKNSTADNSSSDLRVVVDGVARSLLVTAQITLTAQGVQAFLPFTPPILVDRGTVIDVTGAFTVGAMSRVGSIVGYTVETVSPSPQ